MFLTLVSFLIQVWVYYRVRFLHHRLFMVSLILTGLLLVQEIVVTHQTLNKMVSTGIWLCLWYQPLIYHYYTTASQRTKFDSFILCICVVAWLDILFLGTVNTTDSGANLILRRTTGIPSLIPNTPVYCLMMISIWVNSLIEMSCSSTEYHTISLLYGTIWFLSILLSPILLGTIDISLYSMIQAQAIFFCLCLDSLLIFLICCFNMSF